MVFESSMEVVTDIMLVLHEKILKFQIIVCFRHSERKIQLPNFYYQLVSQNLNVYWQLKLQNKKYIQRQIYTIYNLTFIIEHIILFHKLFTGDITY